MGSGSSSRPFDSPGAGHGQRPRRHAAALDELIDAVDGIVWEADGRTLRFTFVSQGAERLLGYSRERWLGQPDFWQSHLHPDDRDETVARCLSASAHGESHDLEYRLLARDGRTVWIRDLVAVDVADDGSSRLRGVMVEISARRRAEEALIRLVHGTANVAGVPFFKELTRLLAAALDVDFVVVAELMNQTPLRLRTLAHWAETQWVENFDYEIVGTPCEQVLTNRRLCFYARDVQRHFPDDEYLAKLGVESYMGSPLFDCAGRVSGHVCVFHREPFADEHRAKTLLGLFAARATMELERQRTEQALRVSEAKYRSLFTTAGVALWEFDASPVRAALEAVLASGVSDLRAYLDAHPAFVRELARRLKPLDVNDAAVQLYDARGRGELLAVPLETLFLDETRAAFKDWLVALAMGGGRFQAATRVRTLRGDVRDVWTTMNLPRDAADFAHVPVSVTDLTDLRRVERQHRLAQRRLMQQQLREKVRVETELNKVRDQLVQRTRLSTIGQVAASIAHELRNPLGAIRNAAYYLERRSTGSDAKWQEYLGIIKQEIHTADRIIANLLEMTRAKQPVKSLVELDALLQQALDHLERADDVRLDVRLDPLPFEVYADAGQLRQVFENLLTNSVQAMNGKGTVSIDARAEVDAAVITVADDGPGVPPEIERQVFEPLFTTKAKGTGLGLAICRQIVEQHDGTIGLVEATGGGCAFRIVLPRRAAASAAEG